MPVRLYATPTMNIKTELLGKVVREFKDREAPQYRVAAVWLATGHHEPTATLRPVDKFGNDKPGPLKNVDLHYLFVD